MKNGLDRRVFLKGTGHGDSTKVKADHKKILKAAVASASAAEGSKAEALGREFEKHKPIKRTMRSEEGQSKAPKTRPSNLSPNDHYQKALDAAHSVHGDLGLPRIDVRPLHQGSSNHGQYVHDRYSANHIALHPDKPHPVFAAIHEHGHYVDHQGLGTQGRGFASEEKFIPDLMKAIQATSETKALKRIAKASKGAERKYLVYLARTDELFARAYSQYIATKTNHPELIAGLTSDKSRSYGKMALWSEESFAPISREFDALFASRKP